MTDWISETWDAGRIAPVLDEAKKILATYAGPPLKLMEVCGTHTAAIAAGGLRSFLPPQVHLVSGPGCPVCVTPAGWFDQLAAMARQPHNRIACFGDMIRVPGYHDSLALAMAQGAHVHLVYSPLDCLDLCRRYPDDQIIMAAVGFETTAPSYALLMERARREGLSNLKLFTALRRMPPVLARLCRPDVEIDGFLAPGHVSAIIGSHVYEQLAAASHKTFVVASFEPERILVALATLILLRGKGLVINQYAEVVRPEGNRRAQAVLEQAFRTDTAEWRGLGLIEDSGYVLGPDSGEFLPDLPESAQVWPDPDPLMLTCRCGEILLGQIEPEQCPLFGKLCRPDQPVGPCMVSTEGICGIHFRYPEA